MYGHTSTWCARDVFVLLLKTCYLDGVDTDASPVYQSVMKHFTAAKMSSSLALISPNIWRPRFLYFFRIEKGWLFSFEERVWYSITTCQWVSPKMIFATFFKNISRFFDIAYFAIIHFLYINWNTVKPLKWPPSITGPLSLNGALWMVPNPTFLFYWHSIYGPPFYMDHFFKVPKVVHLGRFHSIRIPFPRKLNQ